ncbi:MAG: hypothetical protein BWY71_00689 [Planctomycetes bacterium ADurb.Bin412]|nr:MAG: hypothetical protein BWY71_00689 [Planctomycetes bacterium ADurb.Bin412]
MNPATQVETLNQGENNRGAGNDNQSAKNQRNGPACTRQIAGGQGSADKTDDRAEGEQIAYRQRGGPDVPQIQGKTAVEKNDHHAEFHNRPKGIGNGLGRGRHQLQHMRAGQNPERQVRNQRRQPDQTAEPLRRNPADYGNHKYSESRVHSVPQPFMGQPYILTFTRRRKTGRHGPRSGGGLRGCGRCRGAFVWGRGFYCRRRTGWKAGRCYPAW